MKYILSTFTALALAASISYAADEGKKSAEGDKPAASAEKGAKPKANPEEVFAKKDKDADKALTLEEFKAGAKDPAKAEETFKKKDKDGDGKLSVDEFKAGGKKKDK